MRRFLIQLFQHILCVLSQGGEGFDPPAALQQPFPDSIRQNGEVKLSVLVAVEQMIEISIMRSHN